MKFSLNIIIAACFVGGAIVIGGYLWLDAKAESAKKEIDVVGKFAIKFAGQLDIALKTPRYLISNRIAELNSTKDELSMLSLKVDCVQKSQEALEVDMRAKIYSLKLFMGGDNGISLSRFQNEIFPTYNLIMSECSGRHRK